MAQHPMHVFASFIMRSRMSAILITGLFAALSLLMPPLSQVSGAVIALVTLRLGAREGLFVTVGAGSAVGVLSWAILSSMPQGVVLILGAFVGSWIPVWILAMVLRATRSVETTLVAAAGLGISGVVIIHLWLGDATDWWRSILSETIRPALENSGTTLGAGEIDNIIESVAGAMTGVVGAGFVAGLMTSLFIGRWWQSVLYNPGGFRAEFHALRIGRQLSMFTLVVTAIATLAPANAASTASDAMLVLIAAYMFGGVALMHAAVAARNGHVAWLIAMYLMLAFLLPQMAVVLAAAGFADSWMNLRKYFR